MDFEISHSFAAPPAQVAGAMLDEEYQRSLAAVGALEKRDVLEQTARPDGTVLRRVRCVPDVTLPSGARRFIGDAGPAWVEEAVWDPERMAWDWQIHPEVAPQLLTSRGSIELAPDGAGTRRTVTGSLNVRIPLYGKRIEASIVTGVRRTYDEEARRLTAWLERGD